MIIVDLHKIDKLKKAMGFGEYIPFHNTHSFFRMNGIKIHLNVDNDWQLTFKDYRKEALFRIQYSDIL